MLRRALICLALLSTAIAARAAPVTMDELMQALASLKAGRASFVEEKRIVPLLSQGPSAEPQTLRATGELSFEAPNRFERHTLEPRDERLAVDGNVLVMSRGRLKRTTQLDSVPEAQAIVEAVRGTLTGNRAVLERYFDTALEGTLPDWHLTLTPKDERLRTTVTSISMRGQQALLREVTMQLVGGDSSVMTITPIASTTTGTK
jgi:outer membrane lipoprotein-sorting protein